MVLLIFSQPGARLERMQVQTFLEGLFNNSNNFSTNQFFLVANNLNQNITLKCCITRVCTSPHEAGNKGG